MRVEYAPPHLRAVLLLAAIVLALSGCNENRGDATLYENYCASCHGIDGKGLRALYPPLKGSDYLAEKIAELPCLISGGVRGSIITGNGTKNMRMPAFPQLSNQQMTSLIAYLQLGWGNGGETVSEQTIAQWLRTCP